MEVLRTTVTKEGQKVVGDIQYDVIAVSVNGVLTEVGCNIIKKLIEQVDDANEQPVENHTHIGYIKLQNGRTVTEMSSDEDLVKHMTKFSEITESLKTGMEVKALCKK